MSNKLFKVAGITVHNGNAKVRFTDDLTRRVKQFTKGGATRCDFVELPGEMTKVDALRYLLTHAEFQSAEDQATINEAIQDREKDSRKGEVKAKVKSKTKAKPSIDSIKARGKKKVVDETTAEDVVAATQDA
jgi:hypothetical protein